MKSNYSEVFKEIDNKLQAWIGNFIENIQNVILVHWINSSIPHSSLIVIALIAPASGWKYCWKRKMWSMRFKDMHFISKKYPLASPFNCVFVCLIYIIGSLIMNSQIYILRRSSSNFQLKIWNFCLLSSFYFHMIFLIFFFIDVVLSSARKYRAYDWIIQG